MGKKGPAGLKVRTTHLLLGLIIVALVFAACSIPCVGERIALWKGEVEAWLGWNAAALADFEGVLSKTPENVAAKTRAACLLEKLGQYDRAIAYFSELSRVPSTKSIATAHLTEVYLRRGDYKSALKYADEWVLVSPKESEAHHAKGTCLAHLNRSNEALVALNEAVRLDPSSSATTERGFVMEKTKVFNEVFDKLVDPALESKEDDPDALIRDGERLALAQLFDEAAKRFTAAIKLRPQPTPYYMRGLCYLRLPQSSEPAVQDFITVERLSGDKPFRLSPVVADYKKAVSPDGKEPIITVDAVHFVRANGLLGLKQYKEALVHANKAVKLAPDNPDYYGLRSTIYKRMGQYKLAQMDIKRDKELRAALHMGPTPEDTLIQVIELEGLPKQQ